MNLILNRLGGHRRQLQFFSGSDPPIFMVWVITIGFFQIITPSTLLSGLRSWRLCRGQSINLLELEFETK